MHSPFKAICYVIGAYLNHFISRNHKIARFYSINTQVNPIKQGVAYRFIWGYVGVILQYLSQAF